MIKPLQTKGSHKVVSMLHHHIFNILPRQVKQLHIFYDSCGGQNKNCTVFRYIRYVVTICRRLDKITMTFPERGHSYLEGYKNMALIPQKRITEVPHDWYAVIRECRVKPNSFKVIECDQTLFKEWTIFFSLQDLYKPKLSVPSRPLEENRVEVEKPRLPF
ncbi:hypothetical protein ANN_03195 [Periplaneta americana]|uniref:Uncharacterized protein n=1 Tax=Periplaneta americana TaxID=6978 RepID=A0ABQ8U3B6_PERAM|nr:hypothetical protein ANN_03195 [Periplaneta americana]